MQRVYRITFNSGQETTITAKNAKEARSIAKEKYNLPITQTVCDIFRSDMGKAADKSKQLLTDKMQKLAFEFIEFLREVEQDGLEELVDYKFFTNINHCHVGLNFSSLVDEKELREQADNFYTAITQSYLTDKEKIALLVENVKTIEVFKEENPTENLFILTRRKSNWEKININENMRGCILDSNKKVCDRCENADYCYGVKSIFSDKEVLSLLEENYFKVDYPFNTATELVIKVNLL